MKTKSIKFKLVTGVLTCLTLAVITILLVLNFSYQKNIRIIGEEAVKSSAQAFNNLEKDDSKMLSAALQALIANNEIIEAFAQRDKQKLYTTAAPLFADFKNRYGITHWYFHNPEWNPKVFLRTHKQSQSDDEIKRVTYWNSVRSKDFSAGKELGKTAFALRVVHPVYQGGNLIGYMELGEEINHFFNAMKEQTGNDFAVLVKKKFLDEKEWASVKEAQGVRNNWNDSIDVVLVEKTSKDEHLVDFKGDLAQIPENGMVLEKLKKGDSVFVRGIFPLFDASNQQVGGVFVQRDITTIYQEMEKTKNLIIGFVIVLMIVISTYIIYLMNKLVFTRLNKIIEVATLVVGGAYTMKIAATSDDEIGQFESLFEQFRQVFVDLVKEQLKIIK